MDFYTLISTGLDEKLKCFLCKNYLSYFPLSIISNNHNICGRCTIPEGSIFYHEEALEALCQLLKFPCLYQTQGCYEELAPEEVPQHEETCPFRVVPCVLNTKNCKWLGSLPNLLSHCQSEHSDAFAENGDFEIDLSCSDEHDFLIKNDKKVMICTKKFEPESNTLRFTLDTRDQGFDDNKWQVRVKCGNTTLLHDLIPSGLETKICTKLRLHPVIDESNEKPLLCKIQDMTSIDTQRDDSIISDVFKCGVCHNVARPPIYRCPYDMSIKCFDCEKRCHPSISCPPSEKDNKMSRLIKLVNHPCKYRNNGCKYGSVLRNLRPHESVCCYRSEKCPLHKNEKCTWEGLKGDVNGHVTSRHSNSIFKINSEFKLSSKDKTVTSKFIQLSDHLFRLDCFAQQGFFALSVCTIFEEKYTFKYEVDVIDNTKSGQRFKMAKLCAQNKEEDVFKDWSSCCFIVRDQCCSMVEKNEEDTVLTFKIGIYK